MMLLVTFVSDVPGHQWLEPYMEIMRNFWPLTIDLIQVLMNN